MLKAMVYTWLRESYNDLGRRIGAACKKVGLSLRDAEPITLELIGECFQIMKADIEKENQKEKGDSKSEGIGFKS